MKPARGRGAGRPWVCVPTAGRRALWVRASDVLAFVGLLVAAITTVPGALGAQDTPAVGGILEDTVPSELATPAPAPVDSARAAADTRIQVDLQAALDRVPELAGVRATVEAGVVRLDGIVVGSEARAEAEGLARAFDGVLFVVNRVTETTSLGERLRPTVERLREFFLSAVAQAPLYVVALLIVLLSWLVGRWMRTWTLPAFVTRRNTFLQSLIQRLLQTVALLVGIVVALQLLDAVALAGALAGTAGIAGLAVGFAFKDIVENYLAGTLLSLRSPFEFNDHVVVDGSEGRVVRLTWRNTILMTPEGNHLSVPNARVFGSVILNFTRNPKRRFSFEMGIGSDDDIARAQEVARDVLVRMSAVLEEPAPQALAVEMGDSTVTMRFIGWIDQGVSDLAKTRSEAIRLVKEALESAGVSLPSPEYRVVTGPAPERERPRGYTAGEGNTSVDRSVEDQVLEDRARSTEEDLLTDDGGGSAPET